MSFSGKLQARESSGNGSTAGDRSIYIGAQHITHLSRKALTQKGVPLRRLLAAGGKHPSYWKASIMSGHPGTQKSTDSAGKVEVT